jgi:hypothetical protein
MGQRSGAAVGGIPGAEFAGETHWGSIGLGRNKLELADTRFNRLIKNAHIAIVSG